MASDAEDQKHESLSNSFKIVTKSWEYMRRDIPLFREEIAETYFSTNPTRKNLFNIPKINYKITERTIQKQMYKHSCAVVNLLEALVHFVNGNEETKPILFVLGKAHKHCNVNEKMFAEMKDAIFKVIKTHLDAEAAKAWETALQYIFINYVFPGMHMIETI